MEREKGRRWVRKSGRGGREEARGLPGEIRRLSRTSAIPGPEIRQPPDGRSHAVLGRISAKSGTTE